MKHLARAAFWAVLIVSAAIFILPFWFMLCNSFEEFSYVLPNPASHAHANQLRGVCARIIAIRTAAGGA